MLFYLNFLHELQIQIFVPFFQLIVTFSHALSCNIGFFSPNFLCFFPQKMLKLFYSLFLFLALGQEGSSMQYYTVHSGPVPQFFADKCSNLGPLSLLSDKPTTSHLFLFHVFVWIYKLSDILTYFFFVRVSQSAFKIIVRYGVNCIICSALLLLQILLGKNIDYFYERNVIFWFLLKLWERKLFLDSVIVIYMMLAESYSSHLVPHCPEHNRNLCLKTEPVTVLLYCTVCLASGPDKRFSQKPDIHYTLLYIIHYYTVYTDIHYTVYRCIRSSRERLSFW